MGMRRVKRFLDLEQRSGKLSSSRGTSLNQTSSSQSDVSLFLREAMKNQLNRINSGSCAHLKELPSCFA